MLKIGRYRMTLNGKVFWFQSQGPVTVQHFLCFWIFREARPHDVDRKPKFPPNTKMEYDGRVYRYWKA